MSEMHPDKIREIVQQLRQLDVIISDVEQAKRSIDYALYTADTERLALLAIEAIDKLLYALYDSKGALDAKYNEVFPPDDGIPF